MAGLFDDFERSDSSPCRNAEDHYSFLNRVRGEVWERVRAQLEEYFSSYPSGDSAADLRARFRSTIPTQHLAAWWELYLHAFFSRLGYTLIPHPEVPNSSRRPDFWVEGVGEGFYMEAAVVFPEIEDDVSSNPRLDSEMLDLVNEARSSDFSISLEISEHGQALPKRNEVVNPLEDWLATLDPDAVIAAVAAGGWYPSTVLQTRGWALSVTAFPFSPANRGPAHQVIGTYPSTGGVVTDDDYIRKTVRKKAHRYGALDAPYVIAIMSDSAFSDGDMFDHALYGSLGYSYFQGSPESGHWVRLKNGAFMAPDRARATSVSAVISAVTLYPWNHGAVTPQLWINPWADHPTSLDIGTPKGTATLAGEVSVAAATSSVARVFGLPDDWPGRPWE